MYAANVRGSGILHFGSGSGRSKIEGRTGMMKLIVGFSMMKMKMKME